MKVRSVDLKMRCFETKISRFTRNDSKDYIVKDEKLSFSYLSKFLSGRTGYILGFIGSFGLVGLALAIQTFYNLDPCPLCITPVSYTHLDVYKRQV